MKSSNYAYVLPFTIANQIKTPEIKFRRTSLIASDRLRTTKSKSSDQRRHVTELIRFPLHGRDTQCYGDGLVREDSFKTSRQWEYFETSLKTADKSNDFKPRPFTILRLFAIQYVTEQVKTSVHPSTPSNSHKHERILCTLQ
jgi:hypothetical protein